MERREVDSGALATHVLLPFGPYSHGIVAEGALLFVAGQIPLDETGSLVGEGDLIAQYRKTLESIQAVVEAAGGTLGEVCLLRHYVTVPLSNSDPQYRELAAVRAEFFEPPYPASTMLQVVGLMEPGVMIEVEAVALVDATAGAPARGE